MEINCKGGVAPAEMSTFMENESNRAKRALALWRRWFRESGDPMYRGHGMHCFFCGMSQWPPSRGPIHKKGCVYVKAKDLIGKVGDDVHKAGQQAKV